MKKISGILSSAPTKKPGRKLTKGLTVKLAAAQGRKLTKTPVAASAAVLAITMAASLFGGMTAFADSDSEEEFAWQIRPAGVYESEEVSPYRACVHRDSYLLQDDSYESTETEGGYRHYKCTVCGAEYSYEMDPLVYTEDVNEGSIGASNPLLAEWDFIADPRPYVYWSRDDEEWRVFLYGVHDINGTSGGGPEYPLWSCPVYDLADWTNEGLVLELPEGKLVATDSGYDVMTDSYYILADYAAPDKKIDVLVSDNPRGEWDAADVVATLPLKYAYNPSIYFEDGTMYLAGAAFKGCVEEFGRTDILDAMTADNYKAKHVLAIYQMTGDLEEGFTIENASFPATPDKIYLPVYEGVSLTGWVDELGKYVVLYAADEYDENENEFYSNIAYAYADDLMSDTWYFGDNGVDNDIVDYPGDLGFSGNNGNTIHDGSGRYVKNEETGEIEFTGIPTYTYDNNQGSIVKINGSWYLFGQKHAGNEGTNRQTVAEKAELSLNEAGEPLIMATEITSSGLADYLDAYTEQTASCACCMKQDAETAPNTYKQIDPLMPYVTVTRNSEDAVASYVTNINDGAIIGYKYVGFEADGHESASKVNMIVSMSDLDGAAISVYLDAPDAENGTLIGTINAADAVDPSFESETGSDGREWICLSADLDAAVTGEHAVYFVFHVSEAAAFDRFFFE